MRRSYIDWLRGFAVVVMIEAHSIDAWIDPAGKASPIYPRLLFLAGWAAPLFLFLAGVAIPLAGAARVARGGTLQSVGRQLQTRAWQVFALAFGFRVYSFLLGPGKTIEGIFKPDILNVMGLAMVATAWCWSRRDTPSARMGWLVVPAALCLIAAPLATGWQWPSHLPARLEAYVRINGQGTFALFPWSAFVFLGAIVGEFVSRATTAEADRRVQVGCAIGGAALAIAAYAGSFVPSILPHSSFWTTSPSWALLRAGICTLLMPLAWLWMRRPTAAHWSPFVLFGHTSLFVYWIHIELVYGFATIPIRNALSVAEWLVAYVVFTGVMCWCAAMWARRSKGPWIPAWLVAPSRDSAAATGAHAR